MYSLISLVLLIGGFILPDKDILFIAAGLFAIASAIPDLPKSINMTHYKNENEMN